MALNSSPFGLLLSIATKFRKRCPVNAYGTGGPPGKTQTFTRSCCTKRYFPGIESKEIEGYQGVELLRRDLNDEVEFMTIMTFDALECVISFQGKDYEKAYVPASAQKILKRWDKVASHFNTIEKRNNRL